MTKDKFDTPKIIQLTKDSVISSLNKTIEVVNSTFTCRLESALGKTNNNMEVEDFAEVVAIQVNRVGEKLYLSLLENACDAVAEYMESTDFIDNWTRKETNNGQL